MALREQALQGQTSDEIVELDVGGVTEGFKVKRSLLCGVPGSRLHAMFCPGR